MHVVKWCSRSGGMRFLAAPGSPTPCLAIEFLRLTCALCEGSTPHPRALHVSDGDDRDDGNDSGVGTFAIVAKYK